MPKLLRFQSLLSFLGGLLQMIILFLLRIISGLQ
jgi:hypothetical protein